MIGGFPFSGSTKSCESNRSELSDQQSSLYISTSSINRLSIQVYQYVSGFRSTGRIPRVRHRSRQESRGDDQGRAGQTIRQQVYVGHQTELHRREYVTKLIRDMVLIRFNDINSWSPKSIRPLKLSSASPSRRNTLRTNCQSSLPSFISLCLPTDACFR